METTLDKDEKGNLVLNGKKDWVTNAKEAKLYAVSARLTDNLKKPGQLEYAIVLVE